MCCTNTWVAVALLAGLTAVAEGAVVQFEGVAGGPNVAVGADVYQEGDLTFTENGGDFFLIGQSLYSPSNGTHIGLMKSSSVPPIIDITADEPFSVQSIDMASPREEPGGDVQFTATIGGQNFVRTFATTNTAIETYYFPQSWTGITNLRMTETNPGTIRTILDNLVYNVPVPEPAAFTLAFCALLALAGHRRPRP